MDKLKKKIKFRLGFSLIEMLIVVSVFGILGVVVTQTMSSSLRNSRKSEALGNVREEIDYVVNAMDKVFNRAVGLDCANSTTEKISYINFEGINSFYDCSTFPEKIASGSAISLTREVTGEDVEILNCGSTDPDGTYFQCITGTDGMPDQVRVQIVAKDSKTQGSGAAIYSVNTNILLRNYTLY